MNEPPEREVLVFNEALKLPVNERAHYLSETCHGDVDLQRRVAALLDAHEQAGAFLQEPVSQSRDSFLPAHREANTATNQIAPLEETCGDHVGRYKLLQQIGEGGCGTVYMAEQEEPIRRPRGA